MLVCVLVSEMYITHVFVYEINYVCDINDDYHKYSNYHFIHDIFFTKCDYIIIEYDYHICVIL